MGANMLTLIIQSSCCCKFILHPIIVTCKYVQLDCLARDVSCAFRVFATSNYQFQSFPSYLRSLRTVDRRQTPNALSMEMVDRASYFVDAVIHGHYRQVKFYLDAGYNQDCVDNNRQGSTPLILAVTHVKDDAIRNRLIVLLLQAGANPNLGDRYGLTPLMHSILLRQNGSVRLLQESVKLGSKRLDYGTEDLEGNTALMHAASIGLTDFVLMILERLSAVHRIIFLGQKNRQGFTACDFAEQLENKELAELLSWKNSYFSPINTAGFADPHQLENFDVTTTRYEDLEETKSGRQIIHPEYRTKITGNLRGIEDDK